MTLFTLPAFVFLIPSILALQFVLIWTYFKG